MRKLFTILGLLSMLLPLSSKVWGMDDETLHYNVH